MNCQDSLEFHFDEASHTYTLGGQALPGVTSTLQKAGLIDTRWFKPEHAMRGKAVHEAVFYDIHNDLDVDSLVPLIRGYVDGWFDFKAKTNFKPILQLCELAQYHPRFLYAGKPDLVGFLNGRPVLIDVKTGDSPTARFQTSAYAHFPMIEKLNVACFSLRLFPDSKFSLIEHKEKTNDFMTFLDCLNRVKKS